ncbi:MAG: dockerin type I repeat-containing protein, partial [Planctomycetota bacterium]
MTTSIFKSVRGGSCGRYSAPWLLALAAVGASCSSDDDGGQDSTNPPTQTSLSVSIEADQLAAGVGDVFQLEGAVQNPPEGAFEFVWSTDDGQFFVGDSFAPSFALSGTRLVELDLRLVGSFEVLASTETALTVLDPTSPTGVLGEPTPALPGDIDGDGLLSAVDLLQVRQYLSGLSLFSDADAVERADVDRDGKVSEVDASLLANALLTDSTVATALLPDVAQPGQRMQLFSPTLLAASPKFEIEIPGLAPFEPLRVLPGQ